MDVYATTAGSCTSSEDYRPSCPREDCRYHLVSGARWRKRRVVAPAGADTCVLRLSRGSRTLEEVAALLHCTRERVRQIEVSAVRKLAKLMKGRS